MDRKKIVLHISPAPISGIEIGIELPYLYLEIYSLSVVHSGSGRWWYLLLLDHNEAAGALAGVDAPCRVCRA